MQKNPLFVLLLLLSAPLFGATNPFHIINRTSDLNSSDPIQGPILSALNSAADSLESTINTGLLSDSSQQNFISAVAQANAGENSLLGADRASNPTRFSIGVGAQGQYYSQGGTSLKANNTLPAVGVGGQADIMVGLNAATIGMPRFLFLDGKRLMFYLSGGYFSKTISNVSANFFNVGLNAEYKIIEPKGTKTFNWGGWAALLGINYGTNSVAYSANITKSSSVSEGGETAAINLNMDYSLAVKSYNFTFPIETSTNVTFLYLFTLYFGGAVDLNVGNSQLSGTASGPITASSSQAVGVNNLFSGTGSLNLDDGISGKPSFAVLRGFAGLQLNFDMAKLAFEYLTLSNGSQGGAVLLRVAL